MKIHEYEAKELLSGFGVAVPRGFLAATPFEAESGARQLGDSVCAVKAQIHAGGRGKAGHAGAIVSGSSGTAEAKIAALRAAGVAIAEGPHLIGATLRDVLRRSKGRGREVARWSAAGARVARGDGAPARRGRTKDDLVAARVGGAARTRRRRAGMTGDGERAGHTSAPDCGRATRKSS